MASVDAKGGFDNPIPAGDLIVKGIREKHNLPEPVSLKEIEPVAISLLASPRTSIDAAQLVLNRRVDANERMIAEMIYTPGMSPEERFACLLMEASVENAMKQKGIADFGTTNSLRD